MEEKEEKHEFFVQVLIDEIKGKLETEAGRKEAWEKFINDRKNG